MHLRCHILEGIVDQEEQQIIEDSQPAEEEASPSQERPSSAKPPQSSIKTEHEAKIHIVDSIVYNILASDSTYHTPASESIRRIYDSFSIILAEGVDITTAMGRLQPHHSHRVHAAGLSVEVQHSMGSVSSDRPHQPLHGA